MKVLVFTKTMWQIVVTARLPRSLQRLFRRLSATGLLSIPVLAGSAAYAFAESQDWKAGLDHKPWEAVGFYAVIAAATLFGLSLEFVPLDPVKALFWSAVINGFVAVPIMIAMMVIVSSKKLMSEFTAPIAMRFFGWSATAIMALAAIAMFVV